MSVPGGKPIPGVTNAEDAEWALTKARRWIFRGGDRTDPLYRAYINRWLDYLLTLKSERPGEKAGTQGALVGLHQPHPAQEKPGAGLPLRASNSQKEPSDA